MKKIISLFILLLVCISAVVAQCTDTRMYDIYTPMGSAVETWLMCESSIATREYYDDYYGSTYPNAQMIITYDNLSSTRKFNCHGYAWLRVEQGIDRWIGYSHTTDEDVYMTDGSYSQVSHETFPCKVSWASGDHSAITTEQQGWFISKWNQYPLFRHRWDDTPYGTTNLKYYVKNCITVNFTNQTVTTNKTVTGCIINAQNVTVQTGKKLTLDAEDYTYIQGTFEVPLGAELEVK